MPRRRPLWRLRPDRPGIEMALGDLEAQVMRVVWKAPKPVSVEDVRSALAEQGRRAAYTTIMTTLARLYEKGLLHRKRQGRAYVYWPTMSEQEFARNLARITLDGLLRGFPEPAVSYFVEALSERDPRQLDRLWELLQQKRQEMSGES